MSATHALSALHTGFAFADASPAHCRSIPFQNPSFQRHQHGGEHMHHARGTVPHFNRGEHSANWRCDTREATDWLQDQFRQQSAKAIADKTGQGTRSAESIKQGRNGMTMAHIVSMCRADPQFRAAFFQFCGGILEGEPEMVAALSQAINAVIRRDK